MKYEEPLRDQLKTAYKTNEKERTPEQVQLLKQIPKRQHLTWRLVSIPAECSGATEKAGCSDRRISLPLNTIEKFIQALSERPVISGYFFSSIVAITNNLSTR